MSDSNSITVNKTVLNNGLTVLSEYIPTVRSVTTGVFLKTGSRYEEAANSGVAHLLEHMVFKGTKKRSALSIARSLEDLGGGLNAYTSKEITAFYAHILDSHLSISVNVLSDLVLNPLLRHSDLVKEKKVVQEEVSAVKDTPEEYIIDLFQESLYPSQPLGFPILGDMKSLKKIDLRVLKKFWSDYYVPENMILSVAGNVNHKRLIRLAEKFFQSNKKFDDNHTKIIAAKATQGRLLEVEEPINQTHICIGTESFSYMNDRKFDLIALNTYLGGGMSSRLFQVVREKHGLAYSVYSFLDFFVDSGMFGVYLGAEKSQSELAIKLVMEEITRLKEKTISKKQASSLREQLKGSYLLGLESTGRRMTRMAKNEIYYGRFIPNDEIINKINLITENSLQEAANLIFKKNALNVLKINPSNRANV